MTAAQRFLVLVHAALVVAFGGYTLALALLFLEQAQTGYISEGAKVGAIIGGVTLGCAVLSAGGVVLWARTGRRRFPLLADAVVIAAGWTVLLVLMFFEPIAYIAVLGSPSCASSLLPWSRDLAERYECIVVASPLTLLPTLHDTPTMSVEAKTFDTPDDTVTFEHGHIHLVTVGSITIGREVLEPGWRWSEHVKPIVGTEITQHSRSRATRSPLDRL